MFQKEWGLGLKSTKRMSMAFMMKLGWELITRRNKLWVCILRAKYKCGDNVIPVVVKRNNESNAWRGIRKAWRYVSTSIKWKIGSGNSSNFWSNTWLGNNPLMGEDNIAVASENQGRKVNSYVSDDGNWNWNELCSQLPTGVLMRLASTLQPRNDEGDDTGVWKFSKNKLFSVNSAYHSIDISPLPLEEDIWNLIWKWQGLQCISLRQKETSYQLE